MWGPIRAGCIRTLEKLVVALKWKQNQLNTASATGAPDAQLADKVAVIISDKENVGNVKLITEDLVKIVFD